mmetsp:Transcript_8149/g.9805  ORF Transcript_8149/g.9805 Transcript_8149/m.9805 type:complete len:84 (-) Transcript_8149:426-677(-)|eukprot:scaffold46768_cov37-Tisochrysis_lutea.AAC.2
MAGRLCGELLLPRVKAPALNPHAGSGHRRVAKGKQGARIMHAMERKESVITHTAGTGREPPRLQRRAVPPLLKSSRMANRLLL